MKRIFNSAATEKLVSLTLLNKKDLNPDSTSEGRLALHIINSVQSKWEPYFCLTFLILTQELWKKVIKINASNYHNSVLFITGNILSKILVCFAVLFKVVSEDQNQFNIRRKVRTENNLFSLSGSEILKTIPSLEVTYFSFFTASSGERQWSYLAIQHKNNTHKNSVNNWQMSQSKHFPIPAK